MHHSFNRDTGTYSTDIQPDIFGIPKDTVRNVVLESGVRVVGTCAFLDCCNLRNVEFCPGIVEIEDYAFRNCGLIVTLELPDGLKHIGNGAFSGCAGLRNVHIPRSVRYIGHGAFTNCIRLKDVWLYGDCTVEHDAFDDMPVLHFIDME